MQKEHYCMHIVRHEFFQDWEVVESSLTKDLLVEVTG